MTKADIKNIHFELVKSTLKGCKTVRVTFTYKGEDESYYIFVEEKKNVNYIAQAKKQFYQELQSGEVARTIKSIPSKTNRPWLIATASVLGVAAITFAALFTWKALTNGGGGNIPPEPDPNYVTLTLDAGEGNTVEGTKNQTFKYYVEKGSTFAETFIKMHYAGAINKNNDFLYWTIDNQPINKTYVINEDINLVAAYKPVQTGCLTVTAREDDCSIDFNPFINLQISTNGTDWDDVVGQTAVLKHAGDQVYIKRNISTAMNTTIMYSTDKTYSISGPIEALVNGKTSDLGENTFTSCFSDPNLVSASNLNLGNITLSKSCFSYMFYECTSLIAAPALPATTLEEDCYDYMFGYCSSLVIAPELPATTLADYCYYYMFSYCTSLTQAPLKLPATTLPANCYDHMFEGCISLTQAPTFTVTEVEEYCCASMFEGCSSLIRAPIELRAITLADSCYGHMFLGCSSLIEAPTDLPATTLAYYCYAHMYEDCSSLTQFPTNLPAATLDRYSYCCMFSGCSLLTQAPTIQATELAESCYWYMFEDCTSLTQAPALPIMTLAKQCYANMFEGCTSLTQAPTLPATTLAEQCYNSMFMGCTSLKIREETGSTTGDNKIFTCPSDIPTDAVTDMFADTTGDFADGTPTAGNTYYYY